MNFDVLLGIDMETDIGSFTEQYTGIQKGTEPLLKLLSDHQAQTTFFWTGHAAQHHPQWVSKIMDAGHEIGCHGLYHETLGDPFFHLPNNWPMLPEEVPGRIAKATQIITNISGQRPASFRCPRLWGSTAVVNALENLEYQVDVSLAMHTRLDRLAPYHPASDDWHKPGNLRLLEIPNFCDPTKIVNMDLPSRDHSSADPWPTFRTCSARHTLAMVDNFLHFTLNKVHRPVLAFYFHPWEFTPMAQGSIPFGQGNITPLPFITRNTGPHACEQFELLLQGLLQRGGMFKTARQIADAWS